MSKTLILTGIITCIFVGANYVGLEHLLHSQKWIILSFFVAVSFLFHLLIEQAIANKQEQFVSFYLATSLLRLLLSIIFVGVEIYRGIVDTRLFIINFFVLYLCYTIFEISNLNRKLRRF